MRWTVLLAVLALSACGLKGESSSPYLSLVKTEDLGPNGDVVFAEVEEHARCAGFHRASADLASGAEAKEAFYARVADDAKVAAIELASAKISKELAVEMVDEMARTHAARWSYLIAVDSKADAVIRQASACFEMAEEQEKIIREVVKAKYGFSRQR